MNNLNKLLQKLNIKKKGAELAPSIEFGKYGLFIGLVIINGMFLYPALKNYYTKIFSNHAEITHVVK
jgi:hypothetical protein